MANPRSAVLITGATGGIGTAVTETIHAAGWDVSLLDLGQHSLAVTADKLNGRRAGSASFHAGDAASETDVQAWIDLAGQQHEGIAGLVNVAGLWRSTGFDDLDLDEVDEVVRANLRTAIVCCRLAAGPMLALGGGSIVNFASTAGEYGSISPAAHYAAAKGGVIALTKSLARELSPRGIRVNAVSPGPIDTAGLSAGSDAGSAEVAARTLLGRLGTPQEIADCVAFLISPQSSFVTGHVLRANGGSLL